MLTLKTYVYMLRKLIHKSKVEDMEETTITMYRVTYMYLGEKYDGGTYETHELAEEQKNRLVLSGFHGIVTSRLLHEHHKFCGHQA
jgi:hypothetical protein